MILTTQNTVTTVQCLEIIKNAKNAELCRDVSASTKAFTPIWANIDEEPEFSDGLEPQIKAELLRLAGFFLSYSGKTMNKKHYQERAKNLLTQAIETFTELDLKEKADESNIMLALCYWYGGSYDDCEFILSNIEAEYTDKALNSAYLQVKITRAITHWMKDEFKEALNMVKTLEDPMQLCSDNRLKMMYHNQAGAMYYKQNQYDKALFHFKNAITFSVYAKSLTFEASNCNNLAYLYKSLGKSDPAYFEQAHFYVDKSAQIFESIRAEGWMPEINHTKASILYDQKDYPAALAVMCKSIELARKGDDYAILADSLFLRCKIYAALEEPAKALHDFVELTEVSRVQIGEFREKQFTDEFIEMIYFRKHLSVTEEVKKYKKHLVKEALAGEEFHREKTAVRLGITRGGLYEILDEQFPELYEELGFTKRDRNPPERVKVNEEKLKPKLQLVPKKNSANNSDARPRQGKIQKLNLPFKNIIFAAIEKMSESQTKCFLLPIEFGASFGIKDDAIVLCDRAEFSTGSKFLIVAQHLERKNFICAFSDPWSKNEFLYELESEEEFPSSDYKIFGQIVGFCPLAEATSEIVMFRRFPEIEF